jgi:ABC-type transport system involved in multi-copper enzyme maturation permease subunit
MTFLEQLWAIARNTFRECVRQPVVLVVLTAGVLLIVLSIPFSGFTLMDDQRMFVDIALSTIFVAGTILAAFLATSAITREIDNRTVLTVVSKPVSRPIFVWGKFLGVSAALTATTLFLAFVFMLVNQHGTMPTVATPYHFPVLVIGLTALGATVAAAIWCNYFYGWSFPAAMLGFGVPLLGLASMLTLLFDKDWTPVNPVEKFPGNLWLAVILMWMGLVAMSGIAIAASTRFGQVVTLGITFAFFLLGLMSDWLIARRLKDLSDMFGRMTADGVQQAGTDWNHVQYGLLKAAYAVVPNFQVFWLSDAVQQKRAIPGTYMLEASAYGMLAVIASLSIATMLFQRREVG